MNVGWNLLDKRSELFRASARSILGHTGTVVIEHTAISFLIRKLIT